MTPDEADAALDEAVQAAYRAHFPDNGEAMVTEYLVIVGSRAWARDGSDETFGGISRIISKPAPPWYHQLGMLEGARIELRQTIGGDD